MRRAARLEGKYDDTIEVLSGNQKVEIQLEEELHVDDVTGGWRGSFFYVFRFNNPKTLKP